MLKKPKLSLRKRNKFVLYLSYLTPQDTLTLCIILQILC